MGEKRDSPMKLILGWLKKRSMKVKIFLGALVGLCGLVALKLSIKDHRYFYIASESIHVTGIIVLIYKLFALKTCSGLSLKTQLVTALYTGARLICASMLGGHDIRGVIDLISLLSTLLLVWMIKFKLKSSYIKDLDNLRLIFLVGPCGILALLIHPFTRHLNLPGVLWAFSAYLEAVSILPQLRFMQNSQMVETFSGYYVFALGVSRFFSLAHWIIQTIETRGSYLLLAGSGYFWFVAAFLAEMVQSFILADFCYYYMKSFMQGQLLRKMPV